MSPILDLQMRLRQLGTLRMGELTTRNGKTYPSSRDTWRVTTSDPKIAQAVADQFGGTPTEWDSRSAESLVVDTTTDALPIAVVPGHAISQWWELWSGGGCQRRCDGNEMQDGDPCLCDPEARECKPTTRLSVVVRGIDALGLFRLNTTGYYAAVELGGAVQFLETRTAKGETLEGWLRIEERRVTREGQTKVFKVPVLDVGYGIDRMLPAAPNVDALPNGYKPVALIEQPAVTLEQGLQVASTQQVTRKRGPVFQRPTPDLDDDDSPLPVSDQTVDQPGKITAKQKPALNALYGQLTKADATEDGPAITVDQVWEAVARMRNIDKDLMAELLDGRKLNGALSFAKLRDSLTFDEASNLLDRLGRLADHVKAAQP